MDHRLDLLLLFDTILRLAASIPNAAWNDLPKSFKVIVDKRKSFGIIPINLVGFIRFLFDRICGGRPF
jgi:hypothetical protein